MKIKKLCFIRVEFSLIDTAVYYFVRVEGVPWEEAESREQSRGEQWREAMGWAQSAGQRGDSYMAALAFLRAGFVFSAEKQTSRGNS